VAGCVRRCSPKGESIHLAAVANISSNSLHSNARIIAGNRAIFTSSNSV
jgi:hypothetical protein